jgi:hypothetical protein
VSPSTREKENAKSVQFEGIGTKGIGSATQHLGTMQSLPSIKLLEVWKVGINPGKCKTLGLQRHPWISGRNTLEHKRPCT